jgi:CRP/FNR family transcriptional regulator
MANPIDKPFCSHCEARLSSVLKTVGEPTLEDIAAAKASTQFKKGQLIFREGDTPPGLFCIHQGKVKVYKTGDEGRDQIVRFAKAGDVIGYRSLISGEPYNLSAAALEDSVICCIPRETFFDRLREDGGFATGMFQLLSGQLRKAEDQIVHLAQKPVRERLAETLLILREVYGTEDGGGDAPLNIKLSRNELAAVVGTATETLVRAIHDLKSENLIATEKKKIRILDVDGLVVAGNLHN